MVKRNFYALLCAVLMATVALYAGGAEGWKGGFKSKDIVPSENIITQQVSVVRFDAVRVATGIKVNCRQQAGANGVTVRVPDNLAQYLVVETDNDGVLDISFKFGGEKMNIQGDCNTEVDIVCGGLRAVEARSGARFVVADALRGGGDFSLRCGSAGQCEIGHLTCGKLDVRLSSAGVFEAGRVKAAGVAMDLSSAARLDVDFMDCLSLRGSVGSAAGMDCSGVVCHGDAVLKASSGGNIDLQGRCKGNVSIKASSAAEVCADEFSAADVRANASSGASVKCKASGVLTVEQSSGGEVGYAGRPKQVVTKK